MSFESSLYIFQNIFLVDKLMVKQALKDNQKNETIDKSLWLYPWPILKRLLKNINLKTNLCDFETKWMEKKNFFFIFGEISISKGLATLNTLT